MRALLAMTMGVGLCTELDRPYGAGWGDGFSRGIARGFARSGFQREGVRVGAGRGFFVVELAGEARLARRGNRRWRSVAQIE